MKYYVKELPGGFVTVVDKRFEGLMNRYPWVVNTSGYVITRDDSFMELHGTRTLSRALLGLGEYLPRGLVCDHINRNKLDNRLSNLRAVSQSVNIKNREVDFMPQAHVPPSAKGIRVLRYICGHSTFPTYREMQNRFGYSSPNSITQFLKAFISKGLIRRSRFGYEVTELGYRVARGERLHLNADWNLTKWQSNYLISPKY